MSQREESMDDTLASITAWVTANGNVLFLFSAFAALLLTAVITAGVRSRVIRATIAILLFLALTPLVVNTVATLLYTLKHVASTS